MAHEKRRGEKLQPSLSRRGRKPPKVKSALTGAMIDAVRNKRTKKLRPCCGRPAGYTHGPSEKALARQQARGK